jgi:hypothetical protein
MSSVVHKCFAVWEILHMILSLCSIDTLASCAAINHYWSTIALKILWGRGINTINQPCTRLPTIDYLLKIKEYDRIQYYATRLSTIVFHGSIHIPLNNKAELKFPHLRYLIIAGAPRTDIEHCIKFNMWSPRLQSYNHFIKESDHIYAACYLPPVLLVPTLVHLHLDFRAVKISDYLLLQIAVMLSNSK